MRILLPKAKSEQRRWQNLVEADDVDVLMVDPWLIDILPEQPLVKSLWMNLDQYAGVITVSPTAANVLVAALDSYWPMSPVGVNWFCNGPRTASVLESAGLKARYPKTGHTAEDVLQLAQNMVSTHDKWLIVKGEGGRVTYKESLMKLGASVVEAEVYRRNINEQSLRQMPKIAMGCQILWLSSEFLGEQLLQYEASFWAQWGGQCWVSSPRLMRWAQQAGFQNTLLAPGATPEAMQEMIKCYRAKIGA